VLRHKHYGRVLLLFKVALYCVYLLKDYCFDVSNLQAHRPVQHALLEIMLPPLVCAGYYADLYC